LIRGNATDDQILGPVREGARDEWFWRITRPPEEDAASSARTGGVEQRLYQKSFICDPANKTKSVVLTEEGRQKAEEPFKALFTRKP
jgi:hypothetical protein